MSLKIELFEQKLRSLGHVFCEDCATELVIKNLSKYNRVYEFRRYLNPRYSIDWGAPWHDLHNVVFIYPKLLQHLWDKDFSFDCPSCGNNEPNRLHPICGGLFDIHLIKRSLDEEVAHVCTSCEGLFVKQCMFKTRNGYVCDDCIAYAEK